MEVLLLESPQPLIRSVVHIGKRQPGGLLSPYLASSANRGAETKGLGDSREAPKDPVHRSL
jgi:hypothetical protein